jgi:hypothetical protein
MLCQASRASETRFITVRFGNVLGSAGSVVPLFQRQIERGGPVTVTDPDVERYFMTIPEACQLIMQAAVIGERRRDLRARHGRAGEDPLPGRADDPPGRPRAGRDIEIRYIGLRPGEKRFEELFYDAEAQARRRRRRGAALDAGAPGVGVRSRHGRRLARCSTWSSSAPKTIPTPGADAH